MSKKYPRSAVSLILLAALFATGPAFAERNKAENDSTTDSSKSLASPVTPAATPAPTPAPAAASLPTAATSAPAEQAPIVAPAPVQAAKPNKFAGTFYYRSMFNKQTINDMTGAPSAFLFGQVGYHFTPTKTFSVRQELSYQYAGDTKNPQKWTPQDLFIAYTDSNLVPLKYDYTLTGSFRLYLPTGDPSRFLTKQNGSALAWFILSKSSGKWDWDLHLFNSFYNQTQDSYLDSSGAVQANALYEIDPAFDIAYNITPKWALTGWLQSENITNKPIDGQVRDLRHFILEPGVVFHACPHLSITASYYDYMDISTPSAAKFFTDKESQYRLTLIASF